jgi:type VI secretion system protein ImpG
MRDELLQYYERELVFLRQMGAEFAEKYPRIASRLSLESDKCEDPHVERLIEGFAFLASRIHLKINDEFPEVTESLLNVLYPHYLAPIPSMSIVQFALDPERSHLTTGHTIESGTKLYSPQIQGGAVCRFRTCYPITMWPIEVRSASFEHSVPVDSRGKLAEAMIRISLHCLNETSVSDLTVSEENGLKPIDKLRFYVNGEPQITYHLYELLFNNAARIELRSTGMKNEPANPAYQASPIALGLKAVGFEPDEGMLPYTARSFTGYRLLTEYFTFPEKFLFFDVTGLEKSAASGFGPDFDICIHLENVTLPRGNIDANTFQLGCAPIINLFSKIAEPIRLTHQQNEYHVIADVDQQMTTEVYSVDGVTLTDLSSQRSRKSRPFYSFDHAKSPDRDSTYWYATRRASFRQEDQGTEVYLSLVDMGFNPYQPASDTMTLRITCTNRDLPAKLPFGGREVALDIEGPAPLSNVRCLKKPTTTLRPPLRRGTHWRLISHLAMNHLSIVGGNRDGSPEALQEILLLYNFVDSTSTRKQVTGITSVRSKRVTKQTGSRIGTGFVRGIESTIEFDEEQYVGSGVFIFASVLERFLGLYASVNSFSQLVAKTKQREGELKKWLPRAGEQILL